MSIRSRDGAALVRRVMQDLRVGDETRKQALERERNRLWAERIALAAVFLAATMLGLFPAGGLLLPFMALSVRSNSAGDHLTVAASLGISTGAFSLGFWVKIISDRNDYGMLAMMSTAVPASGGDLSSFINSDGTTLTTFSDSADTSAHSYAASTGTWYYVVLSRDGSNNLHMRVFDDSTSTTPLNDDTATFSTDITAFDNFTIGQPDGGSTEWPDCEFECVRLHVGVTWTDAQCRSESQSYTPVTGGGTVYGNWKLKDIDADSDGINDSGGASHHFTNTNMVNGASTPIELTPNSAALSGTVSPTATAAEIVAGGQTVVATLTSETFVAATLTPAFSTGTTKGATAGDGRTGNGDLTVNWPSGYTPTAGDFALIILYHDQGDGSTPTDWTEITGSPFGSGTEKMCIFYKVLAGGESAPVTTISGSGTNISHCANMAIYPNVKGVGAIGTASAGTGTPMTAGAITTTAANSLVVGCCGRGDNEDASGQTFGASGTGVTETLDAGTSSGNDSQVSAYEKLIASSGSSSGNGSADTSATDPWVSVIIELLCKTPFADARQATINGAVSNVDPANGWNDQVPSIAVTTLVRTSDTVATWTLPALASYTNEGAEVVTWTLPAAILTAAAPLVASPTFTIEAADVAEEEEVTDGINLGDSASGRAVHSPRSVSDGALFGDSARTGTQRASTDGALLGDTTSARQVHTPVSASEGLRLGDLAQQGYARSVSEGITLGENIATVLTMNNGADGIKLGDSVRYGAGRTIADVVNLGDTVTRVGNTTASVTDRILLGDTLAQTAGRYQTDGINLGDSTTYTGGYYTGAVTDIVLLGDVAESGVTSVRFVADVALLGDSVLDLPHHVRGTTDSVLLGDSAVVGTLLRVVSDGIKLGDTVSMVAAHARSITDGIVLGDATSSESTGPSSRSLADGVKLGDRTIGSVGLLPARGDIRGRTNRVNILGRT